MSFQFCMSCFSNTKWTKFDTNSKIRLLLKNCIKVFMHTDLLGNIF